MEIKNNIKLFTLCLFGIGSITTAEAQQDAQYTQSMYNTSTINPAYAGSREVISLVGLYRTQWVGLDGAPKTGNFTFNAPINNKIGIGVSFINDRIGPVNENNIAGDFSYNIDINENTKLYFGIKASVNIFNVDYNKLDFDNPNDALYKYPVDNRLAPNIGSGVYLQSQNGYIGVSVPNFLQTRHFIEHAASSLNEQMHGYLTGGYVFELDYWLKFKPAVLAKVTGGAPIQLDLSTNFLIDDKFTLGLAYRLSAAVSTIAGFQISPSLMVGYAYDADVTKLSNYNSGSHEFFMRYDIFTNKTSTSVSRFF